MKSFDISPKTVRTNWSALILFRIGNEKELEVIFEEYNLGLTRNQWMVNLLLILGSL